MTTVPTQPETHPFTLAKKFKMFAEPEDLEFWRNNPTRLYRVRRASRPESGQSSAGGRWKGEEHWIILKRAGPNTCLARVILVWAGLPWTPQWKDPTQYLEDLTDEDLKVLLT